MYSDTHTPGDWRWSNKGGVLVLYGSPGESSVVLRTQEQKGIPYDLSEADAALIAAAPDLLATSTEALDVLGRLLDGEPDLTARMRVVFGALSDALDKATAPSLTPDQHHEDCDYRNSHAAREACQILGVPDVEDCEGFACNLDCEATAMQVPHLTVDELFQCIVGLEHLRDDYAMEARKDRSHWASQEYAAEHTAKWRADSIRAENLRQRLLSTPNYRIDDVVDA